MINILFLCTGNSARSILAEVIVNQVLTRPDVTAFSAGSHPNGIVNPGAIQELHRVEIVRQVVEPLLGGGEFLGFVGFRLPNLERVASRDKEGLGLKSDLLTQLRGQDQPAGIIDIGRE